MNSKTPLQFLCALLAAFLLLSAAVSALAAETDEATSLFDGIIASKLQETDAATVQEWLDGALTEQAGTTAEWYVLALAQSGDYELSAYTAALQSYLAEHEIPSATTRQKYALALIEAGAEDEYIAATLNDSIGQQGVMSWAFGLRLLNTGCESASHTVEAVRDTLLSLQLPDGGWAVSGTVSDVDVTAMAVQALAPHTAQPAVANAVERAVTLISERQSASGDLASYGVPNAESTAQAIAALATLGIDCATDERFVKNGNTLFDGLTLYRLENGAFSHQAGGAPNELATSQVLCALAIYRAQFCGTPGEPTTSATTTTATTNADTAAQGGNDKLWVSLAIAGVCVAVCVGLFFKKQRNVKNYLIVVLLGAVAVALVWAIQIERVGEVSHGNDTAVGTVTVSIRCDTATAAHIPENGVILAETSVPINKGDTVFDALSAVTRVHAIHMESGGNGSAAYVKGIANVYEFDFGDLSGWIYRRNGEVTSVGAAQQPLQDGDVIEWVYTLDAGRDVAR